MTRQQQWDRLFLKFAKDVSQMSRAVRLQVGAVAVKDRRVVCIGYNGTPEGEDNCCEFTDHFGNLITKPNVIHAEDNLIRFSKKLGVDLTGCTLYITHSPCVNCCELIKESGICRVVFSEPHRDVWEAYKLRLLGITISLIPDDN